MLAPPEQVRDGVSRLQRAARARGDDLADSGAEKHVTGVDRRQRYSLGCACDQRAQPGENEEVPVADEDLSGAGRGQWLRDDGEVLGAGQSLRGKDEADLAGGGR